MISGQQIAKYISSPELIQREDIEQLRKLLEKYPYSSSVYILHLKALALNNHLDFEFHLKKTAAHVQNRERLYEIIHSTDATSSPVQNETKRLTTEETQDSVKTENEYSIKDEIEAPETVDASSLSEVESDTQVIELDKEEERVEAKTPQDNQESIPYSIQDDLDVEIINSAIDVAYVDTSLNEDNFSQEEQITEETNLIAEATANNTPDERAEHTPTLEKEEHISKKSEKELSFVEWLKLRKNTPSTEIKKEIPSVSTEKKQEPLVKETEENRSIDALLEKFIREEPSISRPVKDFYNPAKTAKESIEESDELVTETLAKIYVMQKNYKKAISAYEQLSLLYPEKKTFFASQIKKINDIK